MSKPLAKRLLQRSISIKGTLTTSVECVKSKGKTLLNQRPFYKALEKFQNF